MLSGFSYLTMMEQKKSFVVFWFRRDLRLEDNSGLAEALASGLPVLPVFIFDRSILDFLKKPDDRRVEFIHNALNEMHRELAAFKSGIRFFYGQPEEVFSELAADPGLKGVYTNHDYEPYATGRDKAVAEILGTKGIPFRTFKDQVIFEKEEILSGQGLPYTVFTPYSKRWKAMLRESDYKPKTFPAVVHWLSWKAEPIISLEEMGFRSTGSEFSPKEISTELLRHYGERRDFPSLPATSRLSVHLRFGTISIRRCVDMGLKNSEKWLDELIWREFYMQVLWNSPQVGEGKAFKAPYDRIPWRNNEDEFQRWCEGRTGYPIVDAGMRELNETGFMHNRVRMITASFLVKHLLIDWRWGEAYFAEKLLDFDLAANNGGWQWAAGSGCDAAPYFRVFNPVLQTQKFDKELRYIKKWVPEYNSLSYMQNQVVQHEFARERVLRVYKEALQGA
jgi:deoxyribodipyrimidine photo-lyase